MEKINKILHIRDVTKIYAKYSSSRHNPCWTRPSKPASSTPSSPSNLSSKNATYPHSKASTLHCYHLHKNPSSISPLRPCKLLPPPRGPLISRPMASPPASPHYPPLRVPSISMHNFHLPWLFSYAGKPVRLFYSLID